MEITSRNLELNVDKTTTNSLLQEGTFIEVIDEKKLWALVKSNKAVRQDTSWWDEMNIKWTHLMTGCKPTEKNFLENLLQKLRYDDTKNEYYLLTEYFSTVEYGRVYPKACESLGQMRRTIRHFLCKDLYYDVDIVNAHPTILLNLCEAWDIPCENLRKYVEDRDSMIKIMKKKCGLDRDQAKQIFISLINGGSMRASLKKFNGKKSKKDGKYIKPKELISFNHEMKTTQKLIKLEVNKNAKGLFEELTEGATFNKIGCFMSKYLQMWEELFLEQLFGYAEEEALIDANVSQIILCHDGAMLRKDAFVELSIEEFIDELNERIEERTGMNVKFKSKEFDEFQEVQDILTSESIDWNEEYKDPYYEKYGIHRYDNIESHDEDIANLFHNNQVQNYRFCDTTLYMLDGFGLYKSCSKKVFADKMVEYMKDFMDNEEKRNEDWNKKYMDNILKNIKKAEKINVENYCERKMNEGLKGKALDEAMKKYKSPFDVAYLNAIVGNCEAIMVKNEKSAIKKLRNQSSKQHIVNRLIEKYTDDNFKDTLDTDNNLLGFENGIYDVDTHTFRSAVNGEYVSMSCLYDFYDPTKAPQDILDRKEELFNIMKKAFWKEEDLWYVLKANSRCIRGDSNKEEVAHFYKGVGANMKSVLMDLMRNTFGDYYYTLSYKYFTQESKDCRDPSLYHSAKKRCIEVGEPNQAFTFNSDVFKRTTGNDIIKARTNYQERDIAFKMGNIFIPSNHTVKFNSDTGGNSMRRRVRGIEFPKTFMSEEKYNKLSDDEKKSGVYEIGDATLKDKINSGYFNQAFMLLLIDSYKKYQKEGLELTKNFVKSTEAYFKDISKDRAWFDSKLIPQKKGRICLKSLRQVFCEDNGVSRSASWFGSKCKEYFGETSIKTNCVGYTYDHYNPANYYYYMKDTAEKCKGMMLDGFIVDPKVFGGDVDEDPLNPVGSDDDIEEEEDSCFQDVLFDNAPVPKKVVKKKKKKLKIKRGIKFKKKTEIIASSGPKSKMAIEAEKNCKMMPEKKKQQQYTTTDGKVHFLDFC